MGPVRCPEARRIVLGERMYMPPYILSKSACLPGMTSGFGRYCPEIVFLVCTRVLHATLYRRPD
jgi:hypothetical protein